VLKCVGSGATTYFGVLGLVLEGNVRHRMRGEDEAFQSARDDKKPVISCWMQVLLFSREELQRSRMLRSKKASARNVVLRIQCGYCISAGQQLA
jgi:hypothetical protein